MIRFNCPHCNRFYELHPALAHLPLVCKQCGQRITPPEAPPEPPPAPYPPKGSAPVPPRPAAPPDKPVAESVAPAQPKTKPAAKAPAKPPEQPKRPVPPTPEDDEDEDDGVLVAQPDNSPDIDFNVGGPTAASLSDANRAKPAGLSDANRPRPADTGAAEGGAPSAKDGRAPGDDINLDLLPPEPPAPPKRRAPKRTEPEEPPEKQPEPTLLPFIADLIAFVVLVVVGMLLGEFLARKPTGQVLSEAGSAPKFPPIDLLLWAAPPVMFALIYLLLSGRQRSLGAWLRRRTAR